MKKTYITNIPLQPKEKLLRLCYEPSGFTLPHNKETSFPIIPVIAGRQEDGDEVTVIAVLPDNTDTAYSYTAFLRELGELGIGEEAVKVISVKEDQSDAASLNLLLRILEEIPDDSLVYGDITFGTKPMAMMLLYALNFIPKVKECEVDGIYYGEVRRAGGEAAGAFLYDLTALQLLGDMIDRMKELGIEKIPEMLRKMMK